MTDARKFLAVVAVLFVCGCGYQEYMDRFEDTLAENDYVDKVEKTLGPAVVDSSRGYSIRLPETVNISAPVTASSTEAEELTVLEAGEDQTTTVHYAVYDTPEGVDVPMRVVIFVSRPTQQHKGFLTIDGLANYALDPSFRGEWIGDGILTTEQFKVEARDVPAGPKLKSKPQKRVTIRWTTLAMVQDGQDEELMWFIGFLEKENASAMIAYRVSKSGYTKAYGKPAEDGSVATTSEAIDMSLTTADIIAAPGQSTEPTESRSGRRRG